MIFSLVFCYCSCGEWRGKLEFFKFSPEMLEPKERVCENESLRITESDVSRILSFQVEKKKRLSKNVLQRKCDSTIQYSLVYIKDGAKIYTVSNKSYFYSFMKDQRDLTFFKNGWSFESCVEGVLDP